MQIRLSVPAEPEIDDIVLESPDVFVPQVGDNFRLPGMEDSKTVKGRVFIYENASLLTVRLNLGHN